MNYFMKIALFFFFLSVPVLLFSQNENEFIRGKIIDGQSAQPLPFASIKIKTKMLGVVSNVNGDFQIPLKLKDLSDSIVISCIGYSTTTLSFRDLNETVLNIIKIKQSVQSLNEVIVSVKKKFSASKVLNMAIENIKTNSFFKQ